MKMKNVLLAGVGLATFAITLISCEKEKALTQTQVNNKKATLDDLTRPLPTIQYAVALEKVSTNGGNMRIHEIDLETGFTSINNVAIAPQLIRDCWSTGGKTYPIKHGKGVAISNQGKIFVTGYTTPGGISNSSQSIFMAAKKNISNVYVPTNLVDIQALNNPGATATIPFLYDAFVPGTGVNNPILDIETHSTLYVEEPGISWLYDDVFAIDSDGNLFGYQSNGYSECPSGTGFQRAADMNQNVTSRFPANSSTKYKLAIFLNTLYVINGDGEVISYDITSAGYSTPSLSYNSSVGNIGVILNNTSACVGDHNFAICLAAEFNGVTSQTPDAYLNHSYCFQGYKESWETITQWSGYSNTPDNSNILIEDLSASNTYLQ